MSLDRESLYTIPEHFPSKSVADAIGELKKEKEDSLGSANIEHQVSSVIGYKTPGALADWAMDQKGTVGFDITKVSKELESGQETTEYDKFSLANEILDEKGHLQMLLFDMDGRDDPLLQQISQEMLDNPRLAREFLDEMFLDHQDMVVTDHNDFVDPRLDNLPQPWERKSHHKGNFGNPEGDLEEQLAKFTDNQRRRVKAVVDRKQGEGVFERNIMDKLARQNLVDANRVSIERLVVRAELSTFVRSGWYKHFSPNSVSSANENAYQPRVVAKNLVDRRIKEVHGEV